MLFCFLFIPVNVMQPISLNSPAHELLTVKAMILLVLTLLCSDRALLMRLSRSSSVSHSHGRFTMFKLLKILKLIIKPSVQFLYKQFSI